MAEYVYSTVPNSIVRFFGLIPTIGKPAKVTIRWLESVGFKGKNERTILPILKALKFINEGQVPTDRWTAYRDTSRSKAIMAQAIKEYYSELFDLFPDAHRKDNEALRNFFSSRTNLGERAIGLMVSTFKALVSLADFETDPINVSPDPSAVISKEQKTMVQAIRSEQNGYSISINIELQLPISDSPDVYDKIFEAMKKHLLS